YRPDVVAITTVDWDHPDVFEDRAAVVRTLAAWLSNVPDATVVANLGDPGVVELVEAIETAGHRGPLTGVSLAGSEALPAADGGPAHLALDARVSGTIVERTPEETVLDIDGLGPAPLRARLHVPGDHNATNALVALAAARAGTEPDGGFEADRAAW